MPRDFPTLRGQRPAMRRAFRPRPLSRTDCLAAALGTFSRAATDEGCQTGWPLRRFAVAEVATVAEPVPFPAAEELRPAGLLRWVTTVDHKDIGVLYLLTSFAFMVVGGLEALLIRVQLAVPRNNFLTPDAYDALFTMHG